MPQRTFLFLIMALVAIGAALILNLTTIFWSGESATYLSRKQVRGSAVLHGDKLYTLNFEQQNTLMDYLNRAIPVKPGIVQENVGKPAFDKIVIYRFNEPDIEIQPVAFVKSNLVFSTPDWRKGSLLMDVSHGELQALLGQTFDP